MRLQTPRLIASVLALALLGLTTSSARALTVSPAGTYSATSTNTAFTLTSTGQTATCSSVVLSASISSSGTGTVASAVFTGCRNPLLGNLGVTKIGPVTRTVRLLGTLVVLHLRIAANTLFLRVTSAVTGCTFEIGAGGSGADILYGRDYHGANPIMVFAGDLFTVLSSTGLVVSNTTAQCNVALIRAGLAAVLNAGITKNRDMTILL